MTKKAKNIDLKKLVSLIKGAKSIMVATHEGPDGDGIGSIIALGLGLKQLKKKVVFYMKDPVPKMYRYLPGQENIVASLNPAQKFDLSFIVDLGEIERVGDEFVNHPGRGVTVSLDHHAKGNHNADLNFCLPKEASSGEVIFKVLKALKVKLNKAMATGIYTAMVTDTGSFKYSNTSQSTFAVAAELMRFKIDVWQVALHCFETYSVGRMDLLKRVMATLNIHPSKKIASIAIMQADFAASGALPEDTEGFINFPRSIEGVEVAIAFKEIETNRFKVSLRSKNYADVAAIALGFGGGGHIRASGFKINGTLAEVTEKVTALIMPKLQ